MTDPFDTPIPASRPPLPARAPSRSGRVFRWWLALCLLIAVVAGICFAIGMSQADFAPLHIWIGDGPDDVTISGGSEAAKDLLAIAAVTAGVLVLLLVPLLLLLLFGVLTIVLAAGLGVPILVFALALAAISAPVWLVVLGVWLMRRRRSSMASASARMAL